MEMSDTRGTLLYKSAAVFTTDHKRTITQNEKLRMVRQMLRRSVMYCQSKVW